MRKKAVRSGILLVVAAGLPAFLFWSPLRALSRAVPAAPTPPTPPQNAMECPMLREQLMAEQTEAQEELNRQGILLRQGKQTRQSAPVDLTQIATFVSTDITDMVCAFDDNDDTYTAAWTNGCSVLLDLGASQKLHSCRARIASAGCGVALELRRSDAHGRNGSLLARLGALPGICDEHYVFTQPVSARYLKISYAKSTEASPAFVHTINIY